MNLTGSNAFRLSLLLSAAFGIAACAGGDAPADVAADPRARGDSG